MRADYTQPGGPGKRAADRQHNTSSTTPSSAEFLCEACLCWIVSLMQKDTQVRHCLTAWYQARPVYWTETTESAFKLVSRLEKLALTLCARHVATYLPGPSVTPCSNLSTTESSQQPCNSKQTAHCIVAMRSTRFWPCSAPEVLSSTLHARNNVSPDLPAHGWSSTRCTCASLRPVPELALLVSKGRLQVVPGWTLLLYTCAVQ